MQTKNLLDKQLCHNYTLLSIHTKCYIIMLAIQVLLEIFFPCLIMKTEFIFKVSVFQ